MRVNPRVAVTLLVAWLAIACRPVSDPSTLDARTMRVQVAREGAADLPMRATYFPPATPRAGRRDVPVVVVEPILFRRELLTVGPGPDGGLVSYLATEGFPVWLVWVDAAVPPDPRALAVGVAQVVASIARETGVKRVDLLGLSLGAEASLRALEPLTAPASPVTVRRVVFLGGGFDFAYPHSIAARLAAVRGQQASALCSLDGDVDCARQFRQPRAAVPWLGVLPPADADELQASRDRFPFASHLTRLPVLFVNGKADGIAASESMFPLYTFWGSDEPDPRDVPKLMFLAGRENGFAADYDHFALFGAPGADEVWDHVVGWLKREP